MCMGKYLDCKPTRLCIDKDILAIYPQAKWTKRLTKDRLQGDRPRSSCHVRGNELFGKPASLVHRLVKLCVPSSHKKPLLALLKGHVRLNPFNFCLWVGTSLQKHSTNRVQRQFHSTGLSHVSINKEGRKQGRVFFFFLRVRSLIGVCLLDGHYLQNIKRLSGHIYAKNIRTRMPIDHWIHQLYEFWCVIYFFSRSTWNEIKHLLWFIFTPWTHQHGTIHEW